MFRLLHKDIVIDSTLGSDVLVPYSGNSLGYFQLLFYPVKLGLYGISWVLTSKIQNQFQ